MKKNNLLWDFAVVVIVVVFIANIVMFMKVSYYKETPSSLEANNTNISFGEKVRTGWECPDAEGGIKSAFLQIKYFYSSFCPWCMKEEPILQRLVKNYGNLVHIEWYNIRDCPKMVADYNVKGVPTFVFSTIDNKTEYSHYGFVYEEDLIKLVCDVTGAC